MKFIHRWRKKRNYNISIKGHWKVFILRICPQTVFHHFFLTLKSLLKFTVVTNFNIKFIGEQADIFPLVTGQMADEKFNTLLRIRR